MKEGQHSLDSVLEYRLQGWANWSQGVDKALGYPPISIMFWACYQVAKEKRVSTTPIPCHPDVEEIERWIKELAECRPRLANALKCQYLMAGTSIEKAKQLGCSRAQLYEDIDMAKIWLLSRLREKG